MSAPCPVTPELIRSASTVQNVTAIWTIIFAKYYDSSESFLYYNLTPEKAARIKGSQFPAVTYYDTNTHCVIVVQAMDPANAAWNADTSEVYGILKSLDKAHPDTKSIGILSAGSKFVLFEVTGQGPPEYLIGDAETHADLLDTKASLELDAKLEATKSDAKAGQCKVFVEPVSESVPETSGPAFPVLSSWFVMRPAFPVPRSRPQSPACGSRPASPAPSAMVAHLVA